MPLSPIEIYKKILPKTDCKKCGESTCLAFATKVVVEKKPISMCPYINKEDLDRYSKILEDQYKKGKWVKKDISKDALKWAKQRAIETDILSVKDRIGGEIVKFKGKEALKLPYFTTHVYITEEDIFCEQKELSRYEKVFLYNHIAQGGKKEPTGKFIPFHELPNTISKQKSMKKHVEEPLENGFKNKTELLIKRGFSIGGKDVSNEYKADVALKFKPLPQIPLILLFWDEEKGQEYFPAKAMLLFDETIIDHLDIESILFLCEHLVSLLLKN